MIIITYQPIGVQKICLGEHFQGSRPMVRNTLQSFSRPLALAFGGPPALESNAPRPAGHYRGGACTVFCICFYPERKFFRHQPPPPIAILPIFARINTFQIFEFVFLIF